MKAKKLSVKDMAILAVAAGFAWTKLGLGAAVADVAPAVPIVSESADVL